MKAAEDPKKRHFFFEENGTAYIAQRKSAQHAETEPDDSDESDGSGKKLGLIIAGAAAVVIVIALLIIQLVGGALKPNTDVGAIAHAGSQRERVGARRNAYAHALRHAHVCCAGRSRAIVDGLHLQGRCEQGIR